MSGNWIIIFPGTICPMRKVSYFNPAKMDFLTIILKPAQNRSASGTIIKDVHTTTLPTLTWSGNRHLLHLLFQSLVTLPLDVIYPDKY